ncbi:MAG: hypothetical protein PHG00_18200 [Methylococcales bacterium]|nr:hypothetical protein [Methylococcales bacterium]
MKRISRTKNQQKTPRFQPATAPLLRIGGTYRLMEERERTRMRHGPTMNRQGITALAHKGFYRRYAYDFYLSA